MIFECIISQRTKSWLKLFSLRGNFFGRIMEKPQKLEAANIPSVIELFITVGKMFHFWCRAMDSGTSRN